MRTRAYKEDVAVATALGARVRLRTLCSKPDDTVNETGVPKSHKTLCKKLRSIWKEREAPMPRNGGRECKIRSAICEVAEKTKG